MSPYADRVIADGAMLCLRFDEISGTIVTSKANGVRAAPDRPGERVR
jgi:hypothetical protein